MQRRQMLTHLAAGSALLGTPMLLRAQDKPPLRIVVTYVAGGQTDGAARALAQVMQPMLGRTIIVDNKPGAAGTVGTRYVVNAAPDGDTLLFHNNGIVAVQMLQRSAGYDTQGDLATVANLAIGTSFLMVHESVPARTIAEFLAFARAQPQGITIGNSGINSSGHIAALQVERLGKFQAVHVPFKGSGELSAALISGQVQAQVSVTTDALNPQIQAGRIRLLGVTTKQRSAFAPEVPPIAESLPGFVADGWYGMFAPAKTPLAKREQLSAVFKEALNDPMVRERFKNLHLEISHRPPAEFSEMVMTSVEMFKHLITTYQIAVG